MTLPPSPPHPEGPEHRAALTRAVMDATGLTPGVIEAFIRRFYGAARLDPTLAAAFATVEDWEKHIGTITRFWCSVALMTGEYHGRPMQAHAHLALTQAHFVAWLALFEATAQDHLPPPAAAHMIERARRIARSLEMGLIPLDLPPRAA